MDISNRRAFLGYCLGGIATVLSAAIAWPVFRYLSPMANSGPATKITFSEKDIPEGDVKFFEYAGASAVVVRKRGGGLVALSAVCTHLGCIVQWEKDKQGFLCPCHAGHYSAEGGVIGGPPPKPLAPIPFTVSNGFITIG